MYIGTLCNTPIYIVVSPQCILVTQCIIRGGNVTQCIYPMYINMLHNVYRKCTTMYNGTMLPNLHLQCISKCNQMYIKCNPMYIPLFVPVPECIGCHIHCVAFYIHWVTLRIYIVVHFDVYTLCNIFLNIHCVTKNATQCICLATQCIFGCNPMYIPNVY